MGPSSRGIRLPPTPATPCQRRQASVPGLWATNLSNGSDLQVGKRSQTKRWAWTIPGMPGPRRGEEAATALAIQWLSQPTTTLNTMGSRTASTPGLQATPTCPAGTERGTSSNLSLSPRTACSLSQTCTK